MADGSVPIVLSPEPFSRAVAYLEQPAGRTLKGALVEAVRAGSISADDLNRTVVYVDGVRLARDETLDHVLLEGQVVNIVVEPLGGGGGRKEIGQILMTIAVIAVAVWVGGPAGAGLGLKSAMLAQVASAAVLTLGQAAVAALFAPDAESKAKANERYALQTASNQYRPWAPFPLAIGEVICAPDFAVKTFTQAVGDDVWIYGILGLHYGPCEVEDLKIGDTLVSSMGAGDFRMSEHLAPGPRDFGIYPNDTDQLDLQEELEATTGAATPVIRAASAEGELFEFDFFLPGGLHFQKDDGRVIAASVTLTIRYRPVDEDGIPTGAGTWAAGLTVPLTSTTKEPWRIMRSLALPLGRYEFEIKRSLKPDANEKRRDDVGLTAIRSIAFRKPVADETLSLIEFAVRATALNQGTLAPITCRLKPLCETWDGEAWTAPIATSNPAALTRWLLTGPAPARPLQSEQADVRLRAWSDLCIEYDWKVGLYLTDDRRQADVLGLIEQAGRASLWWDGSQIVASPWVEKPAPRQLFTGSNLKDHRWTIIYPEPVHALRVEFANIDEGGDPDELFVYADGYAEVADVGEGLQAATLIEALRVEGQKTAERAYRDGRWELGARLHRRRVDTWTAEVEHLVSGYGDRVRLAWQRVEGATSSRVRCRRWTGELVTGLRLAQPVEMVPGESYAVDIRLTTEVVVAVAIINPADEAPVITREIEFAVPREPGSSPKRDDLVAFGVPTRISEDTEIIGIEPGEGLTASITGVRYVAPLLMEGETAPIPPLQSRLTRQRLANPPAPRLLGVQPDPAGVRVSFAMPAWPGSPITGFAARWRPTPAPGEETGWLPLPPLSAAAGLLVTPPPRALPAAADDDEGATLIDVEIRAVTASGQSSPTPLSIEGIVVREDPFVPLNPSVAPATRVAPDGSSHGVLVFSVDPLLSAVGIDVIVEVRRYPPGGGAPDAWESAGLPLTSINPVGDIPGLRAGTAYGVRAAFRSAGGWISGWTAEIVETVPAGSNVSADVNPNSPAMLEVFYRQIDEVLASTLRLVEEQGRQGVATTDTQRFIESFGRVDPATGRVDMRDTAVNLLVGRSNMRDAVERVDDGFAPGGLIRQPVPRDVSELSGIYNEQIEITPEGELVINNPGGAVTGGQVLRVQEATGFLGHDAFVRRSPSDTNQGGRQFFEKPLTNTTLTGDLAFDVYQSTMRWFDATTLYGVTLPFNAFQPSIGGRIVVSTPAGIVAGDLGSTSALRAPGARIGNDPGDGYLTLVEGDATYSGRMELFSAAGARLGFVGLGTSTTLVMSAETGVNWAFDQRLDMLAGAAVTGALTVSGLATLSGGAAVTGDIVLTGNYDTIAGADRRVRLYSSTSYYYDLQSTGNDFQILEAGDPSKVRLHIDYSSGGFVGIGTTAPTARLSVQAAAGSADVFDAIAASGDDLLTLTHQGSLVFSATGQSYKDFSGADESGPAVFINRDIGSVATSNEHGVIDATEFTRSGKAYNSYDSQPRLTGSATYDHYAGFQARGRMNSSGTLANYYGFASVPAANAGTITNAYGFLALDPGGAGAVTNNYGVYVGSLVKGSNNFAIYIDGTTKSYFGGNVGIGTTSPTERLDVTGNIKASSGLIAPYARIGYGATGFLTLNEGDATHPGYTGFFTADLTRRGYIGFSNGSDKLLIASENSYNWAFSQRPDFAGYTPWDSQNLPAPFSASSLTTGLLDIGLLPQQVYRSGSTGPTNWNDASVIREGHGCLLQGNHTNGPTATAEYFHPFNFHYENSGNLTQLAVPYIGGGMYYRAKYGGSWNAWNTIWTSETFTPALKLNVSAYTAADVLAKLLTVDGAGSGVDADLLDGQSGAYYRSATNLNAGTVPAARMPALTGDITTSSGAVATTLATVNSNVGAFGSATVVPILTVNGKGLVTAVSTATIAPLFSSIASKPTTLAGYGITDAVALAGAQTIAGVKTFSSIPVAGGLTTVGADMNFRVDTGQGYRWKVNGVDIALLEASGRLSLNAITMGGLGLGEWATWSPTPTAESGTATGLASVYAEVERHGKSVTVNFAVSQTAIGTGAAAILVPLPYAAKSSRNYFGSGKNFNTGADLRVEAVGSNLRITAANSYPMGSGAESLAGSITYQCA